MAFNKWDPKDTTITWTPENQAGISMRAFAEGTFFTSNATEDFLNAKVGASGDVTLTVSNNELEDIEITLMGTARENGLLMNAFNIGKFTGGARGAMRVRNRRLGTSLVYKNCWLKKKTDIELSQEGADMTWSFQADGVEATLNAATL